MSPSINPTSRYPYLKSNTTESGMVSNLFYAISKVIRFILNNPLKALTLGLAAQALASRANDLAQVDQNGMTLLHREAEAGNFPRVQALVEEGANIHAKDNNGQTPLDLTCTVLKDNWPAEEDDDDLTCIPDADDHLPDFKNHISVVDYLVSRGAHSFCTVFNPKEEELVMTGETTTQNLRP